MLLVYSASLLYYLTSYFSPKIVLLPCHQVCVGEFTTTYWENFCQFFRTSVLFYPVSIFFSLPLIASNLWFISSICILCFTRWVVFSFFTLHFHRSSSVLSFLLVVVDFLGIFPRYIYFLGIFIYSPIFRTYFQFLFVFFRGTPILSQTNFVPA